MRWLTPVSYTHLDVYKRQEEGTSVNALLRDYLERYISKGQQYRQATNNILAIAKRSAAASQGRRWTRDELYER